MADDPASRARLWDLRDRLEHPVPAREPETETEAGPIPGRGEYTEAARRTRLDWLRTVSSAPLRALEHTEIPAEQLTGNVENLVASVQVPVGLAGPLLFRGDHVRGQVVAPLATTEGALVASVSRGASAISRCGGVTTKLLGQRMTRAPAWQFADADRAARFARWIADHREAIESRALRVSNHSRLVDLDPVQLGWTVHVRFTYESGDAAGQNMTTACTWHASQWINEQLALLPGLDPTMFIVEGNLSGDKKATYLNLVAGRGSRVLAECFVDADTLWHVLKATPADVQRGHICGTLAAQHAGMLGYSINAANVIAAMFVATGQDVGCVHESGAALFSVEAVDGGIHASIVLPNLVVGTVGGGTALPTQRDCLDAMGCAGDGGAPRLAEIICGFALALDLSTQCAVLGGQFADAHERLGRNRAVDWLGEDDLAPALFEPLLARSLGADDLRVHAVEPIDAGSGSSIVTELTARGTAHKLVGIRPLRVTYTSAERERHVDVVAKVKPLDAEVILESNKLASLCGGPVAEAYARWRDWTGFKDTHTRELGIYRSATGPLAGVLPRLYGIHEDAGREAYVVVVELLGDDVILLDAGPSEWTTEYVDAALRGIADVHATWLGRVEELHRQPWLGRVVGADRLVAMRDLWSALLDHNARHHPDCLTPHGAERLRELLAGMPRWCPALETLPRTFVHNDFSPRNIALRRDGHGLVAYDWELATVHVPQRDLVELLVFALDAQAGDEVVAHHLDVHRRRLESAAGRALDPADWRRGYALALGEFALTRLQLYLMAHTHREYAFVPRVTRTTTALLEIEAARDGRPW